MLQKLEIFGKYAIVEKYQLVFFVPLLGMIYSYCKQKLTRQK